MANSPATSSTGTAAPFKGPKLRIPPFDHEGDRFAVGSQWKKWIDRFERELCYNGLSITSTQHADLCQMALLIHVGPRVEEIHDSLPSPVPPLGETWTVYQKSKQKLAAYFQPKQHNDFLLYELMQVRQAPDEALQAFYSRLRTAADKCTFDSWSADKMIKCLLLSHMRDEEIRVKCLKSTELGLDEILLMGKKKEDACAMNQVMTGKNTTTVVAESDTVQALNKKGTYSCRHHAVSTRRKIAPKGQCPNSSS